ncbi:MAG: PAS domain S-box protein [Fibrobacter sp.]|nr:PAS domain S-box protein [Fibrobacter sp.]
MIIASLFSLLSVVICFSLAVIILTKNSKNSLNRVFFIQSVIFAATAFTEFLSRISESADRFLFWSRLGCIWTLSVSLFFHFVVIYIGAAKKKSMQVAVYAIHLTALVAAFFDYFSNISTPIKCGWGWTTQLPLTANFIALGLWGVSLSFISVILLLRFYVKPHASKMKKQIKVVISGIVITFCIGFISEWILPLFSIRIPELTNTSFSIIAGYIAYALWNYDLFGLRPEDVAETIIQTMSDAMFVVNTERRIEIVNNALLTMLGYSEQELIGNGPEKLILQLDNSNDSLTRFLKNGVVTDLRANFRKKNGNTIPVSLSWSVLHDREKRLRGIVFIGRDISERERDRLSLQNARNELEKRVELRTAELEKINELLTKEIREREVIEKNLASQKENLAVTLRSIADGVISASVNGDILFLNNAAEHITGWSAQDAIGKKIDQIYKVSKVVSKDSAEISTSQEKMQLISKSGSVYIISESVAPIIGSEGEVLGNVYIFKDISDREILEEELFRARKLESVNLLASGLAHDFNNILTGIITNLFIAKMNCKIEDEIYQIITNAEKAAFRASSLTKQLISFSKDCNASDKEITSIKSLIEESVGFYLSGSKSDYRLEFGEQLWNVEVDRAQIDQVLNNLIINADQAMPNGGIITVKAENIILDDTRNLPLKSGNFVKVSIVDEGDGIPPENLQRIFDPYFTTKKEGNGLGLSSAFTIIQKHGGHISVNSHQGKGSVFSIFLPALMTSESSDGNTGINELQRGKGKILVLDDEEVIRKSADRLLSHLGYKVYIAHEGAVALDLYKAAMNNDAPFDVLILDLTIPGGKGASDIIDDILTLNSNAKVIVSSGYSNDEVMVNFKSYGFSAAISKPYNVEDLSRLLQDLIST